MGHLILLRGARETTVNETTHLSIEEAASYIDGTLSDDARAAIERHLAECDSCREEVAASARLVATVPTQARRGVPWRLVLPLAAGILVAVMLVRPASRPDATPTERGVRERRLGDRARRAGAPTRRSSPARRDWSGARSTTASATTW